jgi:general L-amino acid transport system permease protein
LTPAASSIATPQRPCPEFPGTGPRLSWTDLRTRAIVWQILVLAIVCVVVVLVGMQTAANLKARSITSGFDYLGRAAGFEISPGPLAYSSRDTYARALTLGLLNTLRVALLGILIASVLGLLLGVARLSKIWVVSTMSSAYVEVVRNTPLLLQLLFWYSLSQTLPDPRHALNPLPGVFLCLRGLYLPGLGDNGYFVIGAAFLAFLIMALLVQAGARYRWENAGLALPTIPLLAATVLVVLSAVIVIGRPFAIHRPALSGFDFRGGLSTSPEFAALLIGLSTYTAAFIAEIVRGGILAIDRGQTEAASALGLSRATILRLVVLPQALPIIIPPTTSQFLSLVKNSSLAVAIGYPDLISITNTTLNQTGQAIEAITVAMVVYLAISLSISLVMNRYNRAVAMRGRG